MPGNFVLQGDRMDSSASAVQLEQNVVSELLLFVLRRDTRRSSQHGSIAVRVLSVERELEHTLGKARPED
jgi:hypothetical protein